MRRLRAGASGAPAAATCFGKAATIAIAKPGRTTLGTDGADVIVGTGGNDRVLAGAGDDRVCGGAGDDVLSGLEGDDRLDGGAGGDGLLPGDGDDVLDGGTGAGFEGIDLAAFTLSRQGVTVDLRKGTAVGEGRDTLRSIEAVAGTRAGDTLVGDAGTNTFFPGRGDDLVDGGGGFDFVQFQQGVTASLAKHEASGEGEDRLDAIEGLAGCTGTRQSPCADAPQVDRLVGDGGSNYLSGGDGDDVLESADGDDRVYGDAGDDVLAGGNGNDTLGGGPGNDVLKGGAGAQDSISYLEASNAVRVDLSSGKATGDGADSLAEVETASGSTHADTLIGDDGANFFFGNVGADSIVARGGPDFLGGGEGTDALDAGAGDDYCVEGEHGAACETAGLPGPVPGRGERPPVQTRRTRTVTRTVTRARMRAAIPGGALQSRAAASIARWLGASRLAGPLAPLPRVRRTAGYEYFGVPTCKRAPRITTTIGPPKRVEPIGNDGKPEEAWWRATLYRERGATRRSWVTSRKTPWARAQLVGVGAGAGLPIWQSANKRRFITKLTYTVPAGRYAWVGQITWQRSGGTIRRWIEPHIEIGTTPKPRKTCGK